MKNSFTFGEISTRDLDLVIQTAPVYNFPEKDVTIEHIPGRNGDLVIDNKCWKNVNRTYSVASAFRFNTHFIENAEKLVKWLTSYSGYQRLEDSYDPLVYRMAMYKSPGSMTDYYDKATVLNVTFECKPQRYLKDGETPIEFLGNVAILENPTGKPALPEITIKNITHVDNNVLLVTVKNYNEHVTSTITLSDLPSGDITINSEMQTVYLIQNGEIKNANNYISLNQTQFPVLEADETEVSINRYSELESIIPSYDSLINISQKDCLALFKPFDSLIESKQKSIYIKSYDLLKQQAQQVYEAEAYSSYCLKKAKEYTFISFNTILSNTSQSYTFQEDYSSAPDWLSIVPEEDEQSQETGRLIVSVGDLSSFTPNNTSEAYFISSADKKISKLATGAQIGIFNKSTTVTITVYPATTDTVSKLAVNYDDYSIPEWLNFDIEYDDASNTSPTKIIFKAKQTGFYYLPKSGLFGKAGWEKITISGTSYRELTSFSWSSYKKAFMPSGISTSTTASVTYSFLPYPYSLDNDYLQYEPTYKDVLDENGNPKKDANGNVIQEIDNDVYFKVVPSNDIKTVQYYAKKAGYFRFNNGDQGTAWAYKTANQQITDLYLETSASSSNIIYYLEEKPAYNILEGFPTDWLEEVPILYDNNDDPISPSTTNVNPSRIDFVVKLDGWYRYTYDSNGTQMYTSWIFRRAGELLGNINPDVDHPIYPPNGDTHTSNNEHNESFFIYYLEGTASNFPIKEYRYTDSNGKEIKDIGFFYTDNTGHQSEYTDNLPPSWLKVLAVVDSDDKVVGIKYQASSGVANTSLFKWDANTVWKTKASLPGDSDIVESGTEDDTSIYYLSSAPSYPLYTLFNVVVDYNSSTGNPESVTIKAKIAGYYRPKDNSNWKYYNVNDTIYEAKTTESITIYNLENTQDSLSELEITIIPRWWML